MNGCIGKTEWVKEKLFDRKISYICYKNKLFMRLTQGEIDTIVRIAREIYGWGVEVFLFGSRTDDSKRGGDIDLLVRSTGEKKGILERVRMVTRLKLALGDRKIDVIGDYEDNAVVQEALLHGIRLI